MTTKTRVREPRADKPGAAYKRLAARRGIYDAMRPDEKAGRKRPGSLSGRK